MKVFIFSMILLISLTIGVFGNIYFLSNYLSELRTEIASIPLPAPEQEDLSIQAEHLVNITTGWKKAIPYVSLTVNHADLMEVGSHLAAATGAAQAGTRENYLVSLAQLDYALSHISDMAQVTLTNII